MKKKFKNLKEVRKSIDKVDDFLVKLIAERELETLLETKDVTNEQELDKIKDFLNTNNKEVNDLFECVCDLSNELKSVILKNKNKQKELEEKNIKYKALIQSDEAIELTHKIKYIRTTVENLDHFLVKEGVKGPRNN